MMLSGRFAPQAMHWIKSECVKLIEKLSVFFTLFPLKKLSKITKTLFYMNILIMAYFLYIKSIGMCVY